MIFITGDKHGYYRDIIDFCFKYKTTKEDIMIVLGDAGINYYLDKRDYSLKEILSRLPITLFCIHGNHEERPENIKGYEIKKFHNAMVYYEKEYPNILFAKDGEIYEFNNKQTLVIGGAYSVDKDYRLLKGYNWYESEQLTKEEKDIIRNKVINIKKVDVILSHTCPYKYMPYEVLLSGIDQSTVDNSMELFLDEIDNITNYNKWYCGHYHTDKEIDNIRFMMDDIIEF